MTKQYSKTREDFAHRLLNNYNIILGLKTVKDGENMVLRMTNMDSTQNAASLDNDICKPRYYWKWKSHIWGRTTVTFKIMLMIFNLLFRVLTPQLNDQSAGLDYKIGMPILELVLIQFLTQIQPIPWHQGFQLNDFKPKVL